MAHYDDCEPDCTVAPLHLARHLPGCGMTRPLRNEADVLAAAQARISRPSAERDAITALVMAKARALCDIPDVAPDFWVAFAELRDAVTAHEEESDRLADTIATSEQIVLGDTAVPTFTVTEPADVADITPREADFLDRWRADVAARADEFERGGSL
jgi:hypothetical protein